MTTQLAFFHEQFQEHKVLLKTQSDVSYYQLAASCCDGFSLTSADGSRDRLSVFTNTETNI